MKKKQGFTLVELLAVIVILAIIALIATPTILGVIENARRGAATSSALGYIDAVEKQIIMNSLGDAPMIKDGTYKIGEVNVSYKGEDPQDGTYIVENGTVVKALFQFNKYYICYSDNKTNASTDQNELIECSDINENAPYKELILNGAYPELKDELVAVTIEEDGTVKKANINNEWYSYQDKEWANAVMLKDNTITYNDEDIIPEENIESYFVWVPRYRYKLFNMGEYTGTISGTPTDSSIAQTIEIVFENKETEISLGTKVGDYLTHPAFTTFNTNGLWVGKFETGYDGATTVAGAQVSSSDSSKIVVKPNTYSWRSNIVSNIFIASYNYNRNLNSHMMKNTEWGAVAYLSHSVYGINGEVNINNNSNYLTGYSAAEGSDQSSYPGTYGTAETVTLAYNTETGYRASTTGNITGIYDMAGGAHEYMAAYMDGVYGSSGFDATSIASYDSKYFDIYPSTSTVTSYNNRILGDATGEMGPFYYYADKDGTSRYHNNWYADYSNFVDSSYPWFNRGGNYYNGVLAGQFSFNRYAGGSNSYVGSRLVLAD